MTSFSQMSDDRPKHQPTGEVGKKDHLYTYTETVEDINEDSDENAEFE
jgi:hypothetical protein